MNISGPAAVAKPEMLFYAPGDLTVTNMFRKLAEIKETLMSSFTKEKTSAFLLG